MNKLPRELSLGFVVDHRGVEHQVIEQKTKDAGVRYVMAQDSETAKERDQYKLRAHLQVERIAELENVAQKAFWAGYEDSRLNPHLSNIQKAWERYTSKGEQ